MKRFYQTGWQGIEFASFARVSATRLADAEFYNAFYRELFRQQEGYDGLDATWRQKKAELADWIAGRVAKGSRILSVGAGLGYMERCLHRTHGQEIELHVQDYASDALRWLRRELPADRIHGPTGDEPSGSDLRRYRLIYLSGVDYALENKALVALLTDLRKQLDERGACLLISLSHLAPPPSAFAEIKARTKAMVKQVLGVLHLYDRGQFWGWMRSTPEYRELMGKAGYAQVTDGFIRTPNQVAYFIEGRGDAS